MPASSRIFAIATPAAPAPEITTRVDSGVAVGDLEGVGERGEGDHGGAVLVVVEDRDVEPLLEAVLDLEATRRRDVLEVDAAEARREPDDGLDDLVDVGGREADRYAVDAAELLEEDGLALHHRHRRGRADVAETEHRRAVTDDGDRVGHPGVVLGQAAGRPRSPRTPRRRQGCRPGTAPPCWSDRPLRWSPSSADDAGRRPAHPRAGGKEGRQRPRGTILAQPRTLPLRRPAAGLTRDPTHSAAAAARAGHVRRRARSSSGTTPRRRESTPSAGLSDSNHQPPGRCLDGPFHRDRPVGEPTDHDLTRSWQPPMVDQQPVPRRQRRPHRVPAHDARDRVVRRTVGRPRPTYAPRFPPTSRRVVSQPEGNAPFTDLNTREDPHVLASFCPHPRGVRPL